MKRTACNKLMWVRSKCRWWIQRCAYQFVPLWMLPICDFAVWLLKTRQEREWDKQIAESAKSMVFVDAAFPNAMLVNEAGEKCPYMGVTYMSKGESVAPLLNRTMPKGFHLEATSMTEKLPE
jgi:hypothetical protein